ncbi:50S ribosomal protein L31 [Legionella sp. 16cNR16C]|uniref:50S ribosomal protein L31 n=1 Tax=Legionella sp. 16cNR16C TaxID=2905656 RepID=UPI002690D73F
MKVSSDMNAKVSSDTNTSIHPQYEIVKVTCSCGHSFETRSTLCKPLNIEVCAYCHPFYTGKQKLVDTGGRVQKFLDRYKKREQ